MTRRVKKTWIVENTWVCSSCGHKNKGRHMECQNCGSPKEKHEKYDTSENLTAPEVTDPEMLRQARAGKNWECEYCGGSVRNLHGECKVCGGPKTDEANRCPKCGGDSRKCWTECDNPEVRPGVHLDDTMPGLRETLQENDEPERKFVPNTGGFRTAPKYETQEKKMPRRRRNWKPWIVGGSIFAGIASVIGLVVFIFLPHEEHVTITSTEWVYVAHLQQRETRSGSGWDDQMPASSFNESCHTRQRGTENCNPHDCNPHQESYSCRPHDCNCRTTCRDQGNGYSSCSQTCSTCYDTCYRTVYDTCYDQCPVYDQWCEYDYYVWPTIRTERLSGPAHRMREPELVPNPRARAPQRVVREHHFTVVFVNDEGEEWTYHPESATEYDRFIRGQAWVIEVNHAGGVYPQTLEQN